MLHPLLKLIFVLMISTFSSHRSFAFFRDSLSISFTESSSRDESQLEVSGGAPPLRWNSGFWGNSVKFKSFEKQFPMGTSLKPSSLMYTPVFNQTISPELSLVAGGSIGRRNASSDFASSYNTLFASGFLFLNSKWGEQSGSYWSVGLVFLDQTASVKVVPGFGFNYLSEDGAHRWIFTFPRIGYLYQHSDSFTYGIVTQFDSDTFNLNPESALAANSVYQYLAIERVTLGPVGRWRLGDGGLWLTGKIGYTLWGQTLLLKKENPSRERDKLQGDAGFLATLSFSYQF